MAASLSGGNEGECEHCFPESKYSPEFTQGFTPRDSVIQFLLSLNEALELVCFKNSPGDSNVQPGLRTAVLIGTYLSPVA